MNALLSWCRNQYQAVSFNSWTNTLKQQSAMILIAVASILGVSFVVRAALESHIADDQIASVSTDRSDQFIGATNNSSEHMLKPVSSESMTKLRALANLIPEHAVVKEARYSSVNLSDIRTQKMVQYIAKQYRISVDRAEKVVNSAFHVARVVNLDPYLILGVIAVESSFNPNAQNDVGAKGLMQVLAKVHADKFKYFGGMTQVLKPDVNIKVGSLILKDCIARAGSIPGGLKLYVGAVSTSSLPYSHKVLAMRDRFKEVANYSEVLANTHQKQSHLG